MNTIHIGQRFISEAEPELGLGLISEINSKTIKIQFLGSMTERIYALKGAPLKRVLFNVGDDLVLRTGEKLVIDQVDCIDGLMQYFCADLKIDERELADFMSFSKPEDRLLNGEVDHAAIFDLRLKANEYLNRLTKISVRGLIGPKLNLLPHQFYVADKVSDQPIPRVLLADEVGLGKTIEAGLIIHKLVVTERAKRVLIMVPDSLVYQWFVEMHRKFHLNFTTLNQETYLEPETNPFLDNDLVIVNIGLLKGAELARELLKKSHWDLMVVDEAHLMKWSPNDVSIEYKIVESVAKRSLGILLLTATPEQMGIEGHFARLKLIDPNRFFDFSKYLEEVKEYKKVGELARKIINENTSGQHNSELQDLQDLHGTGRIFYRNTREKMSQEYSFFPRRKLHAFAIENKKINFLSRSNESMQKVLFDEKVEWLIPLIEKSKGQKILLISHFKSAILDLEKVLQSRLPGISVAVFHSGLSFIARDRQAAFFKEKDGAQIMLCTEVGSEGRNFEFAHHLVLFDIPENPDTLEQRIGRLDRIGQSKDIMIHIPYGKNSYEEILFNWYHLGFNAFSTCAKGAGIVYHGLKTLLESFLDQPEKFFSNSSVMEEFILKTKTDYQKVLSELDNGKDILVELNSFEPEHAHHLVEEIISIDKNLDLFHFMNKVFDELGVDVEDLDEDVFYIKPSENMYVPYFPCLQVEGLRITFDRKVAIERDDVEFLSWDHPMVVGVIELLTGSLFGSTSAMTRKQKTSQQKTFLECYFKLNVVAPKKYSPSRFLHLNSLRVLIDSSGEDFSQKWSKEMIDEKIIQADPDLIKKLKTLPKNQITQLLKKAHEIASNLSLDLKTEAVRDMEVHLEKEIVRLKKLREKNPIVREEEILELEKQKISLRESYLSADVNLDSLRIIF